MKLADQLTLNKLTAQTLRFLVEDIRLHRLGVEPSRESEDKLLDMAIVFAHRLENL